MNRVVAWISDNKLTLNELKTKVTVFGAPQMQKSMDSIKINKQYLD